MNETVQLISETLQPILLTAIQAVVAAVVPALAWKLNEWAKSKVHDARFHCAMDKVTRNAEAAVLHVAQTYTKGVRRTGRWDGEAAAEAGRRAREHVRKLIGPKGMREVMGCLGHDQGGVDSVIDTALEGAVADLKAAHRIPSGGHVQPNEGASER